MVAYTDKYWWSRDNLRLHYRDYSGRADRPPILCLPGLTRNHRDFAPVAERLAGEWRVICVDLRGRADSAYAKESMSYVPFVYLQDIDRLIEDLAVDRFIGLGTSLGGIILMLLAGAGHGRMAGALLNDIGPVIEPAGLERIKEGVGSGGPWHSWVAAARALSESQGMVYPDFTLEDWIAHAKRLYRLNGQGRVVPDYDARIAEPFKLPGGEAGFDLWPAFSAFGDIPVTLVRGALSDLFSETTAREMAARLPDVELVTVPRVGHAPTLFEPEAEAAIDRLLARVLEREGA